MRADEARLQEVLRLRKENFDAHAGPDTRDARQLVPGRSWAAWSRALGLLLPPLTVADLGCGEGYLTVEAARWASQVIAVDRSDDVLDARARRWRERRRVDEHHLEARRARAAAAQGRVGRRRAAVAGAASRAAIRRAPSPRRRAITAPGGRVLLLDLREHDEAWVRAKLGDRWLGFDDDELKRMLTGAGLCATCKVGVGARKAGDPFTVLIASGIKRRARPHRNARSTTKTAMTSECARHNSTRCSPSGSSSSTARWAR